MIPYLIYTALLLAGCITFYKLLLQRETFFKLNRFVLISFIAVAFGLPWIKLPQEWSLRKAEAPAVIYPHVFTDKYSEPTANTPKNSGAVNSTPAQKAAFSLSDLTKWAVWLYWFGVLAFAINFLIQLGVLIYQAYTRPVIRDGRYRIVEVQGDKAPCSFGNNIFINPEKYDWDTYNQILLHEKIHVQQKHTIDLILAELLIIFQWFNPFAWIYRKTVENNLEFLTDHRLLQHQEVEKAMYQMSLLKVSAPHFPLSLTTNYNQSLLKKRIFMMNSKRSNVHTAWKYFFIIPIMVLFASIFNETTVKAQSPDRISTNKREMRRISTEGSWFATIKDDKLSMQFKADDEDQGFNSNTFKLSEFKDLPRDHSGTFSLTRDAGVVEFTGKFEGAQGMGHYKFTPNKDYAVFLKKEGIDETDDQDLMAFFLVNVQRSYVQMLKQNGYSDLSKNDLLPLAALDINEAYIKSIKAAGFSDISISNLIPFRALKVDADYINEIRKAGYPNASADKIISFKAQGIDAKYIADMKNSVQFKSKTEDDHLDVNPDADTQDKVKDKGDKIKDKGDKREKKREEREGRSRDMSDDIVAFKALGIDADYINSFKSAGYDDLTSSELTGMKATGVTPEFIKSIQAIGYPHPDPNTIVALKANGINASLIKEYRSLGFESVSLNDVIGAKATGTTPGFITSMKQKGHDLKNINKYIQLRVALD